MQDPDRRTPAEAMIAGIDHLVLTVRSKDETCAFYVRVLGFRRIDAFGRPTALAFADQKINVHEAGHTFEPKALAPTAGAGDFCLVCRWPMAKLRAQSRAGEGRRRARSGGARRRTRQDDLRLFSRLRRQPGRGQLL